ncbi:MAG: hypothetical protein O3A87_09655 [Verrucomicrobia bacterium]|nr:hypothetical protein [Verrucomicrobiota bacterium]MDA1006724.1 hypothetical protein [Verrucomicrobiota bacterium]
MEDDAHGGGVAHAATVAHAGEPTEAAGDDLDGVEEEVESDAEQQQSRAAQE